jgi:prepilin-type processing-associated H-X9-DG protein
VCEKNKAKDCSYFFDARDGKEFGIGRSAAGVAKTFARGPNDDLKDTPYTERAFGSAHSGVINFVFGDGGVRAVSTATQTDDNIADGQSVPVSEMSIFSQVVHVSDGLGGSL